MRKLLFILMTAPLLFLASCNEDDNTLPDTLPKIDEATFTNPTTVTNPFYGPNATQTYVYEDGPIGGTPEEEIRINRRTTTKTIMGITCIIHHDLVYKNGILIEDTDDWLAQDDAGNLWYLGEFVKNYDDNGNFTDNGGAWEYGQSEALPGYWLPANPFVGQKYHQEYLKGEAEDQAEVLAINQTVTIGLGTYTNCLVTKDFTNLEAGVYEKKYYAPNVGFIKEEKYENNELTEVLELKEIID